MRFGIVGTNFISDWFVTASRRVAGTEPIAVYSRDAQRGADFAQRHELPAHYDSLSALLADTRVDAVYLASPICAHHSQALAAISAGKHVLCEKTLGVTSAQCAEILAAAAEHEVVVMEEVRPVSDPAWQLIADELPTLGTIRRVAFEKNQYSSRYDDFRRGVIRRAFDPAMGNSALADIGVYCLQPALLLFGQPLRVSSESVRLANGFDACGSLLLAYDEFIVECTYSKVTSSVRPSVIEGEDGALLIDSVAEPARVERIDRDGTSDLRLDGPSARPSDNLHHVIAAFFDYCRAGEVDHRVTNITRWSMQIITEAAGVH